MMAVKSLAILAILNALSLHEVQTAQSKMANKIVRIEL